MRDPGLFAALQRSLDSAGRRPRGWSKRRRSGSARTALSFVKRGPSSQIPPANRTPAIVTPHLNVFNALLDNHAWKSTWQARRTPKLLKDTHYTVDQLRPTC